MTPVPDLAETFPFISEEGTELTIRIRRGIRFGPPVARDVSSADVKYALQRAFLPQVKSPYAQAYFGDIEGVEEFKSGDASEIIGLQAPDEKTLVIRLVRPRAAIVAQALALPISAPVPKEYAEQFDCLESSIYGLRQVSTGPYQLLQNDGSLRVGGDQQNDVTLVRNPNWDASEDFRPAYVDRIEFRQTAENATTASQEILEGHGYLSGDFMPPPTLIQQLVGDPRRGQLSIGAGLFRFLAMNTRVPPFDDVNFRKGVVAGFDREAMLATRGGITAGKIATHIIPPGVPGFAEAGGFVGPDLDFLRESTGDAALASAYFSRSRYKSGLSNIGKLRIVGSSTGDAPDAAVVAQKQLQMMGLTLELELYETAKMFERCGCFREGIAICPNVAWMKDFADPEAAVAPIFEGDAIGRGTNWSQLNDPGVNAKIEDARLVVDSAERRRAWGDVDVQIMSLAPVVPLDWGHVTNIRSRDVNAVINQSRGTWDLCFCSLNGREGEN